MIWRMVRARVDGLGVRIAVLLSIALFPIGLIAVSLTHQFAKAADERAQSNLLALTAQAAAGEEALIRTGFGTAEALAAVMPFVVADEDACDGVFSQFIESNPSFSFAGYISADGILACGSANAGQDFKNRTIYKNMIEAPELRSDLVLDGQVSHRQVIVLSAPVFENGVFDGYISVSLPHEDTRINLENAPVDRPVELITFNAEGEVLSASGGLEDVEARLPEGRPLAHLTGEYRSSFSGVTNDGEERVFAVVPILKDQVYAIGSWPRERLSVAPGFAIATPMIFPIAMWITSLGVAYFAVHRLAIKHIRHLSRDMRTFASIRRHNPRRKDPGLPRELREIEGAWHDLAETVIRDEAELEDTIHDKSVLLKEVHHRVKNNLQLIASIVNMKVRKAKTPEARFALKEVQGRVMSIATVHRSLYETTTEGRVRADQLLRSTVGKLVDAGVGNEIKLENTQSYEPITLYPDQAVPLSLLATEATTNALKYVGRPDEGLPCVEVSLTRLEPEIARLSISNSKGAPLLPPEQISGTGLGTSLIQAFAQQLGGKLKVEDEEDRYSVVIDFPIASFDEASDGGFTEVEGD
ncbi:histidine kinase dimerization/phosphoacceptor domain -containing protein [Celeribacter sp.]|uniref:histidine kinase dimerization/phosphoacceptor domain -containing protein n=1 Tax=Celeribacter sp. TaxID=1890673 RepID=UPI003A919CC6